MKPLSVAAGALAASFLVHGAAAQVVGGETELSYQTFPDVGDSSTTTLKSSVEFAIAPTAALQFDLGIASSEFLDDEVFTGAIHGIYHLGPQSSVGLFYSTDSADDADADVYGLEFGYGSGPFAVEAFIGDASVDDDAGGLLGVPGSIDGTLYGLQASYGWSRDFALTGLYGYGDFSADVEVQRAGVRGEFSGFSLGTFFVGVGAAETNVGGFGDAETYLEIGGRISLSGGGRGATFESRSAAEIFFR
jgi:hypothetical protein